MIVMTDDGFQTAKLAIGLFATKDVGTQWGVNAEMLAGNILIGNKLILQNPNDDGYMMFQVDESGAWLYNAQFVLQNGNAGGLIMIDPKYGIVAGTKLLFDTNGTTVTPEFLDQAGSITFDSEGMPSNANFYLDINTGNAYFRGKLLAKSGKIGGYTIEESYLHAGDRKSYVALNGGTAIYPEYAIWCGAENPASAPFWVKKDGTMSAKDGVFKGGTFDGITANGGIFKNITANGGTFNDINASRGTFDSITVKGSSTFNGTLNAPTLSGTMTAKNGWIEGCGIKVGANSAAPKEYNFYVDQSGNVWMNGSLHLSNGSISWGNLDNSTKNEINTAKDTASNAYTAAGNAQSTANSALTLVVISIPVKFPAQIGIDLFYRAAEARQASNVILLWEFIGQGGDALDAPRNQVRLFQIAIRVNAKAV